MLLNLFPCQVFFFGRYAHTQTHISAQQYTHLLFAGLYTSFLLSFQKLPLFSLSSLTAQSGLTFLTDNHNRHLPPILPLHPRFNPLPIPLSLPLPFLFCSEWRSKAAVSASFPSLIALLAGGGTRSFSDTDGEGGGSSRGGEKKMADLWLLLLLTHPTSSLACLRGHWHLGLTLTHSWHWGLSRQHTEDGRERLEFNVSVFSVSECVCVCVCVFVLMSGFSHFVS